MFWREDDKRILVLFNDKTWLQFNDTWTSAMPEDVCPNVSVAANLLKPKRGFGKVWCEQSGVRTKLGAAIASEVGLYSALTQRYERGQMFVNAQSQVFVLYGESKWE